MSKFNFSVDCVVFGYDSDFELKILINYKKRKPNNLNKTVTQIALPGDLINIDEDIDPAQKEY